MSQKQIKNPEEEEVHSYIRTPSIAGALLKLECASEAIRRIEKEFEKISGGEKWDKTKCLAYLMQIGFKNPIEAYKMISTSSKMISDAEKEVRAFESRAEKTKNPKEKEDLAIKANTTASLVLMKFWEPINRTDYNFGNTIFYLDVKNPLISERKYSREFEEVSVVASSMPLEKSGGVGFSLRKELMDTSEYIKERLKSTPHALP